MTYVDFVGKAISLASEAAKADSNGDTAKALDLYTKAIETFTTAIKYEKSNVKRKILRDKTEELLNRAETLKNPPRSQSAPVDEVRWDDIAGLEVAKDLLKESVIEPIKFPELYNAKSRRPWPGILLYGSPGNGKTYLAKAVATESEATFLSVKPSDLMSKWQGESEKAIRDLFKTAKAKKPAVIFIDEIDALCGARSDNDNDATRRFKNEFLTQMSGVDSDSSGIFVLGATNLPWDLDTAMRRRFKKLVYIPPPDRRTRKTMISQHLADVEHLVSDDDMDSIAVATDGFSASDIATLMQEAVMEPVRTCRLATHFKLVNDKWVPCSPGDPSCIEKTMDEAKGHIQLPPVTMIHCKKALCNTKPTVNQEELARYDKWTEQFGINS